MTLGLPDSSSSGDTTASSGSLQASAANDATPPALLPPSRDFLWLQIRDLPYFRALVRAVECGFYDRLKRQMGPLPSPIYDVGCGDGHFATIAFDRKLDVGLDPWGPPIHEARQRGGYQLLVQADGAQSPFPTGHFASALSNSVLEHIPHIDAVLVETARVLRPGAPFVFCVPNPGYFSELAWPKIFRRLGLEGAASAYTEWFRRISRVEHADDVFTWQARLERAGFVLENWWHYFSPQAMQVLEWGHYFGLPALVAKKLTGRWVLARSKWNLALTEAITRPYSFAEPHPQGTFTFYIARRVP